MMDQDQLSWSSLSCLHSLDMESKTKALDMKHPSEDRAQRGESEIPLRL